MTPTELPLLDLFNQLRQHGLPLGVDDYTLLLRAMQAGFGVEDRHALKRLCRTLWVKSDQDVHLFERLYLQTLAELPVSSQPEQPSPPPIAPEERQPVEAQPESRMPEQPATPEPPRLQPPRFLPEDEPAQVVQAVRRNRAFDEELPRPRFSLVIDYFPVTRRQMKQSWRHLRRMVREGPLEELDVIATVERTARSGLIADLVLLPARLNRADLVLLIDQDGSMVPFHALTRQLVETARRGGRLGQTGIYYFHDYPDRFLYRDAARLDASPVPDVLAGLNEQTAVLIVSDAGAARGRYDPKRVRKTEEFLQLLKQSVRRCAWLNPMPETRWQHTPAGEIARLLPMFEMSRQGLQTAISALRGRYLAVVTGL